MTATITIDAAGRLVLPKAFREQLRLRAGAKLNADLVADRIELTPAPDEGVRVVKRDGRLVITGVKAPFDARDAIKAAREEHDENIVRRVRGK